MNMARKPTGVAECGVWDYNIYTAYSAHSPTPLLRQAAALRAGVRRILRGRGRKPSGAVRTMAVAVAVALSAAVAVLLAKISIESNEF